MINIKIKTIPHKKQRYETIGDYYQKGKIFTILVSDLRNENYEMAVALHEFIESYLCKKDGISEEDITNFDLMFEKEREQGKWNFEEPGNDPRSPYKKQHEFATLIEMQFIRKLGIDWKKYDNYLNKI